METYNLEEIPVNYPCNLSEENLLSLRLKIQMQCVKNTLNLTPCKQLCTKGRGKHCGRQPSKLVPMILRLCILCLRNSFPGEWAALRIASSKMEYGKK